MVDEDPRNRKNKYIEAYLNQREEEHQKAYAQPASTRPVEPATAYPWSRPLPAQQERREPPVERISVRDLALKHAKPYLRPDQETQDLRSDTKFQSLLAKRRPGFKLVKEGAEVAGPSDARRKRLCLYDLYAPRMPREDECETAPREKPQEEAPATEEQPEADQPTEEEREEVKEEADSLLWGPKKKGTRHEADEKPILKVGPGRKARPEEPTTGPVEVEVAPEEAEGTKAIPSAETDEAKTAGGEFCASCGSKLSDINVPQICTGCSSVRCTKCNSYDHEHVRTSIYYDYKFDWPLCISCYSKFFLIQKQMAKAMTCSGNGNLTYAIYYAQNAIRLDPNSKYAEDAARLIQRVDAAKLKKEAMDKAWKTQSQQMSRAKFQDPGWKKQG